MYYNMDEQTKDKSLKLLADPNKLKEYNKYKEIKKKTLKDYIEYHFKYKLSDMLYINIIESIDIYIIIDEYINKIIDQVIECQNLKIIEYSLIS